MALCGLCGPKTTCDGKNMGSMLPTQKTTYSSSALRILLQKDSAILVTAMAVVLVAAVSAILVADVSAALVANGADVSAALLVVTVELVGRPCKQRRRERRNGGLVLRLRAPKFCELPDRLRNPLGVIIGCRRHHVVIDLLLSLPFRGCAHLLLHAIDLLLLLLHAIDILLLPHAIDRLLHAIDRLLHLLDLLLHEVTVIRHDTEAKKSARRRDKRDIYSGAFEHTIKPINKLIILPPERTKQWPKAHELVSMVQTLICVPKTENMITGAPKAFLLQPPTIAKIEAC